VASSLNGEVRGHWQIDQLQISFLHREGHAMLLVIEAAVGWVRWLEMWPIVSSIQFSQCRI